MKLIKNTDDRLYLPCKEVSDPTSLKIRMIKDSMIKLMKKRKGIGLSAPQVGKLQAMFVMMMHGKAICCINPSIDWSSEEQKQDFEGCLSFPGQNVSVKRPETIIAKYTNIQGTVIIEKMLGIDARCYQHELDHLSGITIIRKHNDQIQVP
jgi:peptide deformylase